MFGDPPAYIEQQRCSAPEPSGKIGPKRSFPIDLVTLNRNWQSSRSFDFINAREVVIVSRLPAVFAKIVSTCGKMFSWGFSQKQRGASIEAPR
jgi:hypothetical protein